jgi:hypothetical protein
MDTPYPHGHKVTKSSLKVTTAGHPGSFSEQVVMLPLRHPEIMKTAWADLIMDRAD